jgi:hypothetical protein
MIELLTMMHVMKNSLEQESIERYENNKDNINFVEGDIHRIPTSWIVLSLLIAIGTAYLAYSCNLQESGATRLTITVFAFFFSGFYLLYYFIIYILLNKKCNGKDISTLLTPLVRKVAAPRRK